MYSEFSQLDNDRLTTFMEFVKATAVEDEPSKDLMGQLLATGSVVFLTALRLEREYPELAKKWESVLEKFGAGTGDSPEQIEVLMRTTAEILANV